MFKILIFARRKAGLSREEFIRLYEQSHIPLTDRLIASGTIPPMRVYRRNYLVQADAFNSGPAIDYDVVTEAILESREAYQAVVDAWAVPAVGQEIFDDLAQYMDMESLSYVVVDAHSAQDAYA